MEHLMHQRIDSYYNSRHHKVRGPSIQIYQCLQLGKNVKAQEEGGTICHYCRRAEWKKKILNIVLLVVL